MTRPKPLPNEHLGKYFKQSAKALEQQIAMEARFYGALISKIGKLNDEWQLQLLAMKALLLIFDNSFYNSTAMSRPSSLSTIRIEHDSAGMLAINLPPNSCRSLHFGFLGVHSADISKESSKIKTHGSVEQPTGDTEKESMSDD